MAEKAAGYLTCIILYVLPAWNSLAVAEKAAGYLTEWAGAKIAETFGARSG